MDQLRAQLGNYLEWLESRGLTGSVAFRTPTDTPAQPALKVDRPNETQQPDAEKSPLAPHHVSDLNHADARSAAALRSSVAPAPQPAPANSSRPAPEEAARSVAQESLVSQRESERGSPLEAERTQAQVSNVSLREGESAPAQVSSVSLRESESAPAQASSVSQRDIGHTPAQASSVSQHDIERKPVSQEPLVSQREIEKASPLHKDECTPTQASTAPQREAGMPWKVGFYSSSDLTEEEFIMVSKIALALGLPAEDFKIWAEDSLVHVPVDLLRCSYIVALGPGSGQTLLALGQTVVMNTIQKALQGAPILTIPHPRAMLREPALKGGAWTALQKLKALIIQ